MQNAHRCLSCLSSTNFIRKQEMSVQQKQAPQLGLWRLWSVEWSASASNLEHEHNILHALCNIDKNKYIIQLQNIST